MVQEEKINFKLVDQSVKSNAEINTIAFNSSGSIMIQNEEKYIKVQRFNDGIINLITTLTEHSDWIYCLIYSKKLNSFISSSGDNTIRCWKQINLNDSIILKRHQRQTHWVMCLIISSNKDLPFSGSSDKFQQKMNCFICIHKINIIPQLFELIRNLLEINQNDQFEFQYFVINDEIYRKINVYQNKQLNQICLSIHLQQSIQAEGLKLKFLKRISLYEYLGVKNQIKSFVFELKEGIFSQKQQKTIYLGRNNKVNDEYQFPIIQNQSSKFILIRHNTFIYIIIENKNQMHQIVNQQNCDSYEINGMVTDDRKYLVY
ncbi:unnamed protein product [Paramecium pentaurelia]|uniref:Uncharacterized protein n=1 Tax=Paramecium pentaurelia TaxID=43138 RepID=A0A8S1YD24_9CILI|nr:unnamed protein product [Paramecium pentaurelia]